ncbi:ABC transporter permease [Paenalkalicoccus suaedae]|uniref:ABC transporter permease n=1 Tax=Paenalkalicoccus suaedae TaxID=2592382 RepID=A0A859FAF4_9BACI|nr:ABC transporter permease subunit [Paenalkalicoccus suaedae]QKS69917.1 ABC transporter permease [Paenalkalicoccus suaedae]
MNVFLFEGKKLFRSPAFLLVLGIVVVAISILFIRNVMLTDYLHDQAIQEVESFLSESRMNERMYVAALDTNPTDEETLLLQERNQAIRSSLQALQTARFNEDSRAELESELLFFSNVQAFRDAGGEFNLSETQIARQSLQNEALLDADLAREVSGYGLSLPNFLADVLMLYFSVGGPALLLVLVAPYMTHEFENRSIYFLFSQPINRSLIVPIKAIHAYVAFIAITLCVGITASLLALFFGNSGSFAYPLVVEYGDSYALMTVGSYIFQGLLLLAVFVVFFIGLHLLFSVLLRHTLPATLTLLTVLLAGYGSTQLLSMNVVNPFAYVNVHEKFLYESAALYTAVPVTLAVAGLCYAVASYRLKHWM